MMRIVMWAMHDVTRINDMLDLPKPADVTTKNRHGTLGGQGDKSGDTARNSSQL